jgi:hypothetical protein
VLALFALLLPENVCLITHGIVMPYFAQVIRMQEHFLSKKGNKKTFDVSPKAEPERTSILLLPMYHQYALKHTDDTCHHS